MCSHRNEVTNWNWQPLVAGIALVAATCSPRAGRAETHGLLPVSMPAVPAATAMTLARAIEYAEGHQPELRAARERFLAVAADARIAGAQWLPSIGANAQLSAATANNSTASILPTDPVDLARVGGTAVSSEPHWQPYATTVAAVGLRQELFDFGRIAAEETAANALVAISRDQLYLSQVEVRLIVTQAYYAVRAARAVTVAAEQAEARAQVHAEFAEAAVNSGLRAPIERTRAAADLAKFAVSRTRALGNYRIARAVLAAAVGSPEPELDVDDANETLSPIPSWQEVEGHALRYEPEMQIARDRVQAQRAHTLAIRAKTRPNVFATASLSGRAGGAPASNGIEPAANGFLPTIPNYDVGVILAWPLYDPTVEAAYKASQQREWAFDAELAASQQRTRTIAQQVYRRVQVAQAALLALAKATEAARSNYDQAEARFRAGMGTSTELADAEALRLDAEVQEAVGGFELATARAQLSRSMGE